jgi:[ribosomal protein S5]-alanine N-acetyltransferase
MNADGRDLPRRIETDRLLLRPFQLSDVEDVFAYASDKEWARYLPVPQPYLREHAEEFVAQQRLKDWSVRPTWAVVLEDQVVGGVDLTLQLDHRRASLGYALARPQWSKGLTTEATRTVISKAYEVHGDLNRIQAWADSRNGASRRVLEKLGMTLEGVLRENSVMHGEPVDDAWYGVLRSEWSDQAP